MLDGNRLLPVLDGEHFFVLSLAPLSEQYNRVPFFFLNRLHNLDQMLALNLEVRLKQCYRALVERGVGSGARTEGRNHVPSIRIGLSFHWCCSECVYRDIGPVAVHGVGLLIRHFYFSVGFQKAAKANALNCDYLYVQLSCFFFLGS